MARPSTLPHPRTAWRGGACRTQGSRCAWGDETKWRDEEKRRFETRNDRGLVCTRGRRGRHVCWQLRIRQLVQCTTMPLNAALRLALSE
jgi:hypothetical protein